MNPRTTVILLLANLLVAVGLLITRDAGPVGGRLKLLPEAVDLSGADTIAFSMGSGCPAFSLEKGPKGQWRLDGPGGALANQAAVGSILADLERAPVLPFETNAGVDHGLDPPGRTLAVSASGREIVAVQLGKPHPLNIGIFARVKGEEEIYLTLADLGTVLERRPGNFRELRVFPFSPLDIRRLELERTTVRGVERISVDRKWLTWFLEQPRRLRGDTRAFEGMVSGLLGIRRTATRKVPEPQPNVRVTAVTETARVELDVWVFGDSEWLGRVRGEEDAIPLQRPSLLPLLASFGQLWDRALFHDSARRARSVAWKLGGGEAVVLQLHPARSDVWLMQEPHQVTADAEECRAFIQRLVGLEADGLEKAGTRDAEVGLAPAWGRVRVEFVGGAGERELLIGSPGGGEHRVRFAKDPENIFRLKEKKLRVIPRSALALVDRTIYRGTWHQVSRMEIRRGNRERFLFENVGQEDRRHWRRTDTSPSARNAEDKYISGTPMRNLIVHLTEKLRAGEVLAWTKADAPEEWGVDRPRYVVAFNDSRRGANRDVHIAIGLPQEDHDGETWYPAWLEGATLPERPFVYKIDRELVRRIRAVMPD